MQRNPITGSASSLIGLVFSLLIPFYWTCLIGCGLLVNNTLKSPGYPSHYPSNTRCVYSVSIPEGMALKIVFLDFWLQDPLIPQRMSWWWAIVVYRLLVRLTCSQGSIIHSYSTSPCFSNKSHKNFVKLKMWKWITKCSIKNWNNLLTLWNLTRVMLEF